MVNTRYRASTSATTNLRKVSDDDGNTFCGTEALNNLSSGSLNTAFGKQALRDATTGIKNTAVGFTSLLENEGGTPPPPPTGGGGGHYNTCVGWESGKSGVSAGFNCNFGARASLLNTSGHFGCNYGYQAGANATNNYGGCAFGMQALYYASGGHYNIGVGYQAGNQNLTSTSGNSYSNCIFIGHYSGVPKTYSETYGFGDDNIFIGHNAQGKDTANTFYENQIVIGKEAKGEGDNTVVLGNASCVSWQSTERSGSGTSSCNLGATTNKFGHVFCGHVFCNDITTVLLPTVPGAVGQMWNDNGTVKISSGNPMS